jgi:hypothetical protein
MQRRIVLLDHQGPFLIDIGCSDDSAGRVLLDQPEHFRDRQRLVDVDVPGGPARP